MPSVLGCLPLLTSWSWIILCRQWHAISLVVWLGLKVVAAEWKKVILYQRQTLQRLHHAPGVQ